MKPARPDAVHVWLVMNKSLQAIEKYTRAQIREAGLGDSDFLVLEVLLHKDPFL
jgi:MarR family transcriptional regulator, 2-MHQ and catechol-resistance regulon repressor